MMDTQDTPIIASRGHLALGILAGLMAGIVVGMLYSPHKGSVARRIVRRKGEAMADDALEVIEDRMDELSAAITKTLSTFTSALHSSVKSRMCE